MDIAFLKPVTELGSFALVAWILWYVFNKTIPQQSEQFLRALSEQRGDFKAQREEERKEFLEAMRYQIDQNFKDSGQRRADFIQALDEQNQQLERAVGAIRDEIRGHSVAQGRQLAAQTRAVERLSVGLLYHDATVRGQNPEILGSTQDLLKMMISMDSDDLWRIQNKEPERGGGGGGVKQ